MTSFPTIFHLWVAKIFSIHSSVGWMMPLCAGAWPNSNCPYCQQSNEKWHNFFSSAWTPVSHNSATSNSSALNNGSLAARPPPSSPPVTVFWLTTGQTLWFRFYANAGCSVAITKQNTIDWHDTWMGCLSHKWIKMLQQHLPMHPAPLYQPHSMES